MSCKIFYRNLLENQFKKSKYRPKGVAVLIFLPPLARTTKRERRDKAGSPFALTGEDVLREKEEIMVLAISNTLYISLTFCLIARLFLQASTRD